MLCGDLLTQVGSAPALTTGDVLSAALEAEKAFQASTLAPQTGAVLRGLADLAPTTLAIMHGLSFQGDGGRVLHDMADAYEALAARVA